MKNKSVVLTTFKLAFKFPIAFNSSKVARKWLYFICFVPLKLRIRWSNSWKRSCSCFSAWFSERKLYDAMESVNLVFIFTQFIWLWDDNYRSWSLWYFWSKNVNFFDFQVILLVVEVIVNLKWNVPCSRKRIKQTSHVVYEGIVTGIYWIQTAQQSPTSPTIHTTTIGLRVLAKCSAESVRRGSGLFPWNVKVYTCVHCFWCKNCNLLLVAALITF